MKTIPQPRYRCRSRIQGCRVSGFWRVLEHLHQCSVCVHALEIIDEVHLIQNCPTEKCADGGGIEIGFGFTSYAREGFTPLPDEVHHQMGEEGGRAGGACCCVSLCTRHCALPIINLCSTPHFFPERAA
jgi:hypothetical protein